MPWLSEQRRDMVKSSKRRTRTEANSAVAKVGACVFLRARMCVCASVRACACAYLYKHLLMRVNTPLEHMYCVSTLPSKNNHIEGSTTFITGTSTLSVAQG